MLYFAVTGQSLGIKSTNKPVADSINYLSADFTFTEDWKGTAAFAQFIAPTGEAIPPILIRASFV